MPSWKAEIIRLGYRRIGLVSLPAAGNECSRDHQRGYRAALEEAGRPFDRRREASA